VKTTPPAQNIRALRTYLRALLTGRTDKSFEAASAQICRALLGLPELESAIRVAAFWPVHGEADIRPALLALMERNTLIYLPRMEGLELHFVPIDSLNSSKLSLNSHGIPEPRGESVPLSSLDCVLVPALGFDASCNRLGRGKGFYDRALSTQDLQPVRIGVGFSDQIVEEGLEPNAHDVPMHLVVTEQKIYRH